jgi:exopolysaccharide biosynthesis polyprenyl glycosylphosphotransferase
MLFTRRRLFRLGLGGIDAATLTAAFVVAFLLERSDLHYEFLVLASYAWVLLPIILIWLGCLTVFGLYRSAAYSSTLPALVSVLQAQSLATLVMFGLLCVVGSNFISQPLLPRFLIVSLTLVAFQKLAVVWFLSTAFRRTDIQRRKVVLVSDPIIVQRCLHMMRRRFSMLADVVRVLTPKPIKSQSSIAAAAVDLPLGTIDDLPALLNAEVIDEVIAVSPIDHAALERISRWCAVRGLLLRVWLELPCPTAGHWAAEYLGDGTFLVSLASTRQGPAFLFAKRLIDVLGAVIGIIFCGVVYLRYGRRLQRESGGSSIFCQLRVGLNGRPFTLYKFRTMCIEAEQQKSAIASRNEMSGPIFKLRSDPRVTTTGRKLRRRYLDELPQFWNVLRGDMSLVGTRPPTPEETAVYDQHHHRRLSIKPGITGLWQVNGNGLVKDFEEVVKLDCDYIDRCSLSLDARILSRTVRKVLRGDGW